MDYIKELKRLYKEQEDYYVKTYLDYGCMNYDSITKAIEKTKVDQLQFLINHLKTKHQEQDWTLCKDKLPPRRTLVLVKTWRDGPEYFYKRSFFGLKWLNKGGRKKEEISPSDVWRFI